MVFFSIVVASVGLWVLYGLFTVLVATRPWSWMLKLFALQLSVVPLLMVEAGDLAIMVILFQTTIWCAVAISIAIKQAPITISASSDLRVDFKWNISDLLLLTAIIALTTLLVRSYSNDPFRWFRSVDSSLLFGGAFLTGAALAIYVSGRRITILMTALALGWIAYIAIFESLLPLNPGPLRSQSREIYLWIYYTVVAAPWKICVGLTTMILIVFAKLGWPAIWKAKPLECPNPPSATWRFLSRSLVVTLVGIAMLCCGNLFFRLVTEPVKLSSVATINLEEYKDLDLQVFKKREILRASATTALQKGQRMIGEGQPDRALRSGIKMIDVQLPPTGPPYMSSCMFELGTAEIGGKLVHSAIKNSSPDSLKAAIVEIETLQENKLIDVDQILQKEWAVVWQTVRWPTRLGVLADDERQTFLRDNLTYARNSHLAMQDCLLMEICIELYRQQHQRFPAELKELIPDYLERLPQDPYGNDGSYRYSVTSDGSDYQLYSIGPDHVDSGGKLNELAAWNDSGGDVNFRQRWQAELAE